MDDCLEVFRDQHVLIVGDVCRDVWATAEPGQCAEGSCVRIVPQQESAGMALAVAQMVEALGGRPTIPAVLQQRRPCLKIRFDDRPRLDFDYKEPLAKCDEQQLIDQCCHVLNECQAVILSDYGKGVCTKSVCWELLAAADERHVPVLIDPALGVPWSRYQGSTLIKCNRSEWRAVGQQLKHARNVVVTDGARGMRLHTPDREFYFETTAAEGDTVGCGDQVAAVLGMCLAGGVPLETGCEWANVAAGLKLAKRGGQGVSAEELRGQRLRKPTMTGMASFAEKPLSTP